MLVHEATAPCPPTLCGGHGQRLQSSCPAGTSNRQTLEGAVLPRTPQTCGLDRLQQAKEGREMDRFSGRHDQTTVGPMSLVGREPEIQRLHLFVSRIAEGAGDALLLAGDPGVGKTALLDQAAALAAAAGSQVLRSSGSQFEADSS